MSSAPCRISELPAAISWENPFSVETASSICPVPADSSPVEVEISRNASTKRPTSSRIRSKVAPADPLAVPAS